MKTEYHHSAGNHVVNLPLPVDFPQVNQRTTTDGKSIIQPPKIEHTYTIQCSIYYQYIITLIIYRLYCLICLEIAMCPFYEYPTHNNQHAFFFFKMFIMLSTIDTLQLYWMILMIYELRDNVSTSGMSINGSSSRSHGTTDAPTRPATSGPEIRNTASRRQAAAWGCRDVNGIAMHSAWVGGVGWNMLKLDYWMRDDAGWR